jgi:hypothetical protein
MKLTLISLYWRSRKESAFAMVQADADAKIRLSQDQLEAIFPEFASMNRGETFCVGV